MGQGCRKNTEKEKKEPAVAPASAPAAAGRKFDASRHAPAATPVPSSIPTPTVSFQLVASYEQVKAIVALPNVHVAFLQGLLHEGQDNSVIVTCPVEAVGSVVSLAPAAEPSRKEKPKPAPPVVIDKVAAENSENNDTESDEEKKKKEEKEAADKKAADAKPKYEQPEQTLKASTDVNVGAWDGEVPVRFEWIDDASTFSEFFDPSGENWRNNQNIRRALGAPAKKIVLQYRQGMQGKWTDVPTENGVAIVTLKPSEVTPAAFRGFQSRWIVDGEFYLSPLQIAPTLQSRLMQYDVIRNAIQKLPKDKQKLENIPNENVRKACMEVENIIPMNTWDVTYGIMIGAGAVLNEEHIMSIADRVEFEVKKAATDPKIVSEVRKQILKSPIIAATTALSFVGIKIGAIVGSLDFFLPKLSDPNFEMLEKLEAEPETWENLRREIQSDVNFIPAYAAYQQGIRVTFPTAAVLRNAMISKRPAADASVLLPVNLLLNLEDEKDFLAQHTVQFIYWTEANPAPTAVPLTAVETVETYTFGPDKPSWKKYEAVVALVEGKYRYYWQFDDAPYFNAGRPFGPAFTPGTSYHTLDVTCHVEFGIGVAF